MLAQIGAQHLKLTTRRKTMDSISRALLMAGGISADLDPNAFGFNNVGGANLSTLTTSNTITPIGYDTPTAWSVTNGGQGSVNGGTYATSGTISPGQTFTVRGTSSSSYSTGVSFLVSIGATQSTWSITTMAMPTEAAYTTPGTYTFIVPAGVTSVSAVAVGGGCGGADIYAGGGGGLGYRNNYSVTPGASITIVVGAGGNGVADNAPGAGGSSTTGTIGVTGNGGSGTSGGSYSGASGGGSGGNGSYSWYGAGAGGAAGYSGSGGGGNRGNNGSAGQGGGGGGGTGGREYGNQVTGGSYTFLAGGGGGGVGILGQGANGAGGIYSSGSAANQNGKGGSGGADAGTGASYGGNGGLYGGGGGAGSYYENYGNNLDYYGNLYAISFAEYAGGNGGGGAVRIIWPGTTRLFPSTNTGTM